MASLIDSKVIGLQSAYLRGKYIRVKSWTAVAQGLSKIDASLAQAVADELGYRPGGGYKPDTSAG